MPVVRGKKKTRRERRRFGSAASYSSDNAPAPVAAPNKGAKPVRRRGWQGPPWLNLTLGIVMLAAGAIFAAVNKGNVIIMIAYWAVGGFYLYRYYRQVQNKRSS